MDTLLTIIGVLGLGALAIATWVFAAAARRYVTGEDLQDELDALQSDLSPYSRPWVPRGEKDRRQTAKVYSFPTTINGEYVAEDRRRIPDRRTRA